MLYFYLVISKNFNGSLNIIWNMKKLLTTILLFFLVNLSFSQQVYKWRASDYKTRLSYNNGESWGLWSDWTTSGVLIVAKEQRVNVYSSTPQTYDMIEPIRETTDENNNLIYSVMCVDENVTKCNMIWYHTAKEGSFVIFQFSNLELAFKVVSLD
jgi:hypothetical protein